ncbi:VOC family protein [Lutibacter aestuarii]|uniref:VOC family protein n=1 Tax=Lutibacter aestuarii TaxID=861111 RepID=A0ABW2Z2G3_9FLAO|nr:VOC family protein [uncultured Lutibacter sp.]
MKIKELIIFTNKLEFQIDFYATILELPIVISTPEFTSFRVGKSLLTFKYKKHITPYHFAFNIPSNKEKEALEWLKERVDVLCFEDNEIQDFYSWNSKAIYFYDIDKNIVEFISRKNMNLISETKFSSKQLYSISEIGISSNNIERTVNKLNTFEAIKIYSGDMEQFCALGDEDGLFIIANNKLRKWFPTGDEIYQSDFIVKGDFNFEFKKGEIIEIM